MLLANKILPLEFASFAFFGAVKITRHLLDVSSLDLTWVNTGNTPTNNDTYRNPQSDALPHTSCEYLKRRGRWVWEPGRRNPLPARSALRRRVNLTGPGIELLISVLMQPSKLSQRANIGLVAGNNQGLTRAYEECAGKG